MNLESLFLNRSWQAGFIRWSKRGLVTTLMVAIILPTFSYAFLFRTTKAEAAWYDDSWTYRQRIDATSTNGSAQSNVFISFTLDTATLITAGQMRSSCQDVRITDFSGKLLSYHIGRTNACNNAATTIDFLLSSFPDSKSTYYVYYGNPSASSQDAGAFTQSQASNYSIGTLGSAEKGTGPIGYWKFDEGTGTSVKDSTTTANHGTRTTATWQTEDQCISGKCLYFTGASTSNVSLAMTALPTGSNPRSFSAWFRTSMTGTGEIISYGTGASGQAFTVGVNGSSGIFVSAWASPQYTVTATVNDNRWHNVVVTATGSVATTYLDGVAIDSNHSFSINTGTTEAYIGARISSGNVENFTGFVDEVKMYNYVLSAAQVQANYTAKAAESAQVLGANTQNSSALSNGLVGYWKMDETAANACTGGTNDSCDSSGNGKDGAWNGDATSTAGKFGNGTTYDGTGDYVSVGNISNNATSISLWFYTSSSISAASTAQSLINADSSFYGIDTGASTANLTNEILAVVTNSTGRFGWCDASASIAAGWHHVATFWNGSTYQLYLDGENKNNCSAGTGAVFAGDNVRFGGRPAGDLLFTGKLDDVRIYNRALSPAEISILYNFAPGPLVYYKLDEGSGTSTVSDSSGNGTSATLNTFASTAWTPGKYGKGLTLDGSSDYITNSMTFPTSQGTGEMWIKPNFASSSTTRRDLIMSSNNNYAFMWGRFGTSAFTFWDTTGDDTSSTVSFNADTWHHVAWTWDATTKKMYFDGVQIMSVSTRSSVAAAGATTYMGSYWDGAGNFFGGTMDEIKFYTYARTAGQIVEDMNGGHPAPGSPVGSPVGYWKFNEGADNTCSGGTNDACNSGSAGNAADGAQTNMSVPATSTSGWTNSGKFGRALLFDGTNDYVSMGDPSSGALDVGTGDFTLSAWIKTSANSEKMIISKQGAGTPYYQMTVTDDVGQVGKVRIDLHDGTTQRLYYGGTVVDDGNWHHVVASVTRSSGVTIYTDGIGNTTATAPPALTLSNSAAFVVGSYAGSLGSNDFSGAIDEVKYYNSALTADQIKIDMNQGASEVLGAISDNSSYQKQAANQEYCIPGDSTSCAAPVARYDFNEASYNGTSGEVKDSSGNAQNGTYSGTSTVSKVAGKYGQAARLNGTNNYITVTDSSTLDVTSITIETWVYLNSNLASGTGWDGVINKMDFGNGDSNGAYAIYRHDNGSGHLLGYISTNSSGALTATTTALVANTWYHVALTYTSGSMKMYLNGKLEDSNGLTGTINNSTRNLLFGVQRTGAADEYLDGRIDDVRIFNYARSAAQVAWDYNRGAPVGWWKFDECQGTTLNDSSGNSLTGTIAAAASGTYTSIGTCSTSSSTTKWGAGATGKRNYSLGFDGSDDNASVSDNAALRITGDITISAWVKPTDFSNTGYIVCKCNSSGSVAGPYYLRIDTTGGLRLGRGTGAAQTTVTSTTNLTAGSWQHVAVTMSGTTYTFYINGVSAGSGTLSQTATDAGQPLYIGTDGSLSLLYKGLLDDTRIYNYALTSTQVKTLYNDGAVRYGPVTGAP